MIMECAVDFSSVSSDRGSTASSPLAPRVDASPSGKGAGAAGPAGPAAGAGPGGPAAGPTGPSPPHTPPRDATPTNNNNNNISSKDMEGPMALMGPHVLGPHGHPMAPPHPMSPMRHLGPPGLGLFNSLMGSPLEFMAAAQAQAQAHHGHQGPPGHPQGHPGGHPGAHPGAHPAGHPGHGGHPPRSYNSPPPISSSDPTANECKLVTYRGQKVAAFMISGETMLCLPQAFELFLKHLVGGLHTVYTKLKRLDIVPLVCNVEQVRILRGLGAIQPGVNRCKLLSCKDFDTLYRDCTTARCLMSQRAPTDSRAGRPPKRLPMGLSLPASLQGGLQGHPQLKKHRLENGDFAPFENGHLAGADKSPLLSNGYNAPPSHLQAMQQLYQHPLLSPNLPPLPPQAGHQGHQHQGHPHPQHPAGQTHPGLKAPAGLPGIEAIANWENCRAAYEDIVKHIERMQQERGDAEGLDNRPRNLTSHNGSPNGHSPVLNLSKAAGGGAGSGADSRGSGAASPADQSDSDAGASDKDDDDDDVISNPEDDEEARAAVWRSSLADLSDGHAARVGSSPPAASPPPYGSALGAAAVGTAAVDLAAGGRGDSDEDSGGGALGTTALLRNIQRLLKVAAENARAQEQQVDMEKAELKMDVLRERELKESLERQLMDETRTRMLWQKRLQKERKARRRLQEQLELEMKRRAQLEDALRGAVGSDVVTRELDLDRKNKSGDPQKLEPQPEVPKQGSPSPQQHQLHHLGQQQQQQQQQQMQVQQQKHQQPSPVPDRERQSPAVLDSRVNYYKNSVLFGGAS